MENVDYEEYKRRARIVESSGNDRAVSAADAKGRYQFLESTWKDLGMGGKDIYDPNHQEEAMKRFTQNNIDQFRRKYKREPDYADVYGMHHLGFTGYTRTIDDPNAPVSKYYNEEALAANPHFVKYGTMGNLRNYFANKMNGNTTGSYQTDGGFQYTHSRPTQTENYLPENAFQMEGRTANQVSPIDGRYTKEEKEAEDNLSRKNEAKIRLLEQEIANRQQQQPTTNPYEVQQTQPVQQPQQPTYSYLSNTDLFTVR